MPAKQIKKYQVHISLALIFIITLIAFLPSLKNGFTNWDDNKYILENPLIRCFSLNNIRQIFNAPFFGNYHPLTLLTYTLDYTFFGLIPFGYHLTNLILHLLNCLLIFWLFYALTKRVPAALITTVFFAIHPLHVESVAWISERKDVLYAFFFLGAMISYIYYLRGKGVSRYYYLSFILFIFSLLSKAMAVTLPVVLLLIDYIFYRKYNKTVIFDKIPFFALSFIFGIIAVLIQYSGGAVRNENPGNTLNRIIVACYSLIFYIKKTFIPIKLSCLYPYTQMTDFLTYLYFFIAMAALLIAVMLSGRYTRKVIFGGLLFLVTILPVLQFLPFGHTIVSDRYTYIPLVGIFYLLAEGFVRLYKKNAKYIKLVLSVLLIVVIASLSFLTHKRVQVWKDSITLWSDELKKYPNVSFAYLNRGTAYYEQGDSNRALSDYNKALAIDPFYASAYGNRANLYLHKDDPDMAISDYNKAIEFNPKFADAYSNRGNAYFKKGNTDQALSDYKKAIEIDPKLADAYSNRGNAYFSMGNADQAVSDYSKAIEFNPIHSAPYYNRGNIYLNKGDFGRAIADYDEAIKINPQGAIIYSNRGLAYQGKGNFKQAIADYSRALEINPLLVETYNNRGLIYLRQGDFEQSIADYNEAIKINPNYAEAYNNRGNVFQCKNNFTQAVSDYNKALKINPNYISAYSNRAIAYFKKGEYNESWKDVRKVEILGGAIDPEFLKELQKVAGKIIVSPQRDKGTKKKR